MPVRALSSRSLTPADAIRLKAAVTGWFGSDHWNRYLAADGLPGYGRGLWPERWPTASVAERMALFTADELIPEAAWQDADTIYADPAMCGMVTAAAQSFPAQRVRDDEFLAPIGFLFFAKPVSAAAFAFPAPDKPMVSAITWACVDDGVTTLTWTRQPPGAYEINGVTVQLPALYPHSAYLVPWDVPTQAGIHSVSLLRALSALAKQPLTREDSPKIHQSVRTVARSAKIRPESFRRIALRRPETAAHELAAACAASDGRTPAGHWVRGHWRQQYYASVHEHRSIWIEGFPRGDFTQPRSLRDTLLIAHGDRRRPKYPA
ncbi:hypothetical protein HET69_38980 [Streptomyces sp. CJ_13]|uniref:hypothetical protein n=1 Tax=Streptomyces sp. CJ_13 TaxID=2724943 RepID=UPI001BDDA27C|nr:hypothetical protein [Streptomyces sp. CJ_13]MBT1189808.1 hypothetical protein [Streptomyces sp. CJ_13]